MAKKMSLKPGDMVTGGGGILADTNTRWDKLRFKMYDYGGNMPAVPALVIEYTDLDADDVFEQAWSLGNKDDFTPSKDGKSIVTEKGLRASSNMGMLWASLANAIGEDDFAENVDDDVSVLEGIECHMIQVPDTRPTAKKKKGKDGREYDATIPVVDVVHKLPWDKGKGGSKPKASGDGGDDETAIADFVKTTLAGEKDGVAQNTLAIEAFKNIEGDDNLKTLAATLIHDAGFIKGIDGVVLEDGVLKLG